MDDAAIRFTIKDCHEAAKAMRGWNPEREGYYADQCSTFRQELSRREARA
jgi:hypothetical protein